MSTLTQNEPTTGSVPTTASHSRGTAIMVYLGLGGLAFAVLQSLVAPALSTIAQDLGVGTDQVSWVLTAYLLAAAVLTPIIGKLGDMIGKRKVLIVVLILLLAGTVLAALAPNLGVLIVARILQGAAGAVMPLSIGIVRDELPPERMSVSIGIISAIFGVGGGIGIVAAGPIVENLSWHWLFWVPAVLVGIALLGTIFGMPESPVRSPGRLDVAGTSVLSVALVAILLAVSEGQNWGWGDGKTLGLLALGALAIVVFVIVELRVKQPLIDLRLFRARGVWSSHVVAFAAGFAMFGAFLIVPTLLQLPTELGYGFGMSVSESGLFLLPTVVGMVVGGVVAGALVKRFGPKLPMILGGLTLAVGFALPALAHAEHWQIIASGILTGIGVGFAFSAISNAIVLSVPPTQTGEAISANTVIRTIGSSVGSAVIAAVISSNVDAMGIPTDDAFSAGFWVAAGIAVLALLAALVVPTVRNRTTATQG